MTRYPEINLQTLIDWLLPYQFSWLAVTVYPGAALAYALGMRAVRSQGGSTGLWRPLAFFTGLGLCYLVMHSRFDYYGQFLFFAHRAQHLVLHHVGAMLIALGLPLKYCSKAVAQPLTGKFAEPVANRYCLSRVATVSRALILPVRVLQRPLIGSLVFVGLIGFWLMPAIHFDAMLSHRLYLLMNWSMVIDGVLFWMVIVDPRPLEQSSMPGYGIRLAMIIGTTIAQILIGAFITLSHQNLYEIYAVCGRAWPIDPSTDQIYGGLLTWIPPAMMELAGALIVLSMLMARDSNAERTILSN